jgi:hypothetical protein
MGFKLVSVAILAAVVGAASAEAQSVGKLGGPANPPPAGFKGQQFVDSRGCVFLKAGYGGQTSWVPRVGRDRKALCGFPPTGGSGGVIEMATAAEEAAPAAPVVVAEAKPQPVAIAPAPLVVAQPKAYAAPALQVAPVVTPVVTYAPQTQAPAPYAKAAPVASYEVASTGPGAGKIGCYTSAPVAQRVKLRNGGTAVVCTRGDGTMTGWRPPIYPNGAGVGASLSDPVQVARSNSGAQGGYVTSGGVDYAAAEPVIPKPPKGYKTAWKDDRLNPQRGKGTASGDAQQAQVWTNDVPAKLVADQPVTKRKKVVYVQKSSGVVMSTKNEPTAPVTKKKAAGGGAYVQIGTFGVPANAEGAASRLSGMGLPVARAKITSGGKPMQIVMAGPFGSAADAQAALSMARGAGFGDAFLR